MGSPKSLPKQPKDGADARFMSAVIRFTAKTMETSSPVPFGALIVETKTGKRLVRGINTVRKENDPSSHAELRTVRKATRKLKRTSLKGYTLYSTCEPCPMCMANALWSGLDRLVYGATIEDAALHCGQIHVSAREINERSDMKMVVEGPVLRDEAYGLFMHPKMLERFASWKAGAKAAKRGAKK